MSRERPNAPCGGKESETHRTFRTVCLLTVCDSYSVLRRVLERPDALHVVDSGCGVFSILTTAPNAATSAIHDRMPVILDPGDYDLWLDPGMRDTTAASELLKPFDARLMRCYPVSTRVNSAANDDEDCSRPVELTDVQAGLFSSM